ncbi:MAG: phosphoribosylformylglycinamidine synthase subunit PurQ, partial [Oscillospiraceae bacterium]
MGAFTAQCEMGVPSIGGKDSMSGTFNDIDVPPTLVSFAISMTKASKTGSAALKNAKSKIMLLPLPVCEETQMPDFVAAKELYRFVSEKVASGEIMAASVVKEGGAAAAIAKMAFGNLVGVDFEDLDMKTLFAPLAGSIVVQVACKCVMGDRNYTLLGRCNDKEVFTVGGKEISVRNACNVWQQKLEKVFPVHSNADVDMSINIPFYNKKSNLSSATKIAKPRVLIPVFPGTNCEVDTARAFERVGAEPQILIIKNLSAADIEETAKEIVKAIDNSQIIMFPGGFSGGDEPDGSGKFIATTFRGARVAEAVDRLLNKRDGLILGVCNGFQALIKLGLVPYGEIQNQKPTDPTLTFNTLGRHISRMVYTRVTSVKSPWLSLCEAGDVHTIPVSHGEGRFFADENTVKSLMENGQIATQYVDLSGSPVADIEFNPNGSVCAIEGITSPDGRVFGKMGHSERVSEDCYKNV